MSLAIEIPTLVLFGYLLGTIPSAVWVARSRGVNIYEVGSGNPGASNVYRAVGKGAAVAVFVLDAAKGAAPAAAGLLMPGGSITFGLIGGAAAVIGHTWPVFRRFKGGRGVATGAGALLVCYPVMTLILAVVFAVVVAITRKPSVGSLVAIVGVLVGGVVVWQGWGELLLLIGLVALVLARHTENIKRIFAGEEHGLELESDGEADASRDAGDMTPDVGDMT